jgi:hypothetical protein
MEESCSGKKRRKGDHHQRPQRPEQMSKMEAAAGISGIFDPDVLDCTICFYPLRPPVFQVPPPPPSLLFICLRYYSFSIVVPLHFSTLELKKSSGAAVVYFSQACIYITTKKSWCISFFD